MLWVKVLHHKANAKAKLSTSSAEDAADEHTTFATNAAEHAATAKQQLSATTSGKQKRCYAKESPKQPPTLSIINLTFNCVQIPKGILIFSQKVFSKRMKRGLRLRAVAAAVVALVDFYENQRTLAQRHLTSFPQRIVQRC